MEEPLYNILEDSKLYIKRIHRFVHNIEPWGILIAIIGIGFASYELSESIKERKKEQFLREATLYSMVSKQLQESREIDTTSKGTDQQVSGPAPDRTGYVRILEIMARSGISLEGINAVDVRLDRAQLERAKLQGANLTNVALFGTNLSNANLEEAVLSDAEIGPITWRDKLIHANLSGANMTRSILKDTTIWGANLSRSNFMDAEFQNTKLYFVDLTDAIYLSKFQLEGACGDEVILPIGWTIDPCVPESTRIRNETPRPRGN